MDSPGGMKEEPTNAEAWRWLASTKQFQTETYNYDIEGMAEAIEEGQTDAVDAKYFDWNTTAAVQELAELREEFSWKPWATDPPFVNRSRIIRESVDVLHFIGNMLVAVGCTDEEFWQLYQEKQQINRERAASGTYSARKGGLAEGSD